MDNQNEEDSTSYQSEKKLEALLLMDLVKKGYEEVEIKDKDELEANFRIQLNKFNQDALNGTDLTDKEFELVMLHLDKQSVFQSAKNLRDQFVLHREDGRDVFLSFFSKDATKNFFQVTHQVTQVGKYTNRYDVTLLANGLPIVQVELKRRGLNIKEAFNQIMRYKLHSYKGLFRYIQVFVITNGVDTKYFSNNDNEILYSKTFFWTDEANNRQTCLQDFSDAFFPKTKVTKTIHRFMILDEDGKNLMVMRPYQVYATEAVIRQALDTNLSGFVWHCTGSGKTLTAFKTAQILSESPGIKKIFCLVDRKDLDGQTVKEFKKFEKDSVKDTLSTRDLTKQIKDEGTKLIVTTIQKMSKAVEKSAYARIMEPYRNEKVIFIIDECHRSQFGDMHHSIQKFFTKAQFFGFTGTPLFKENPGKDGRTTADVFGKCLHTYMIKEAMLDNNVLGFNVEYIKTMSKNYDENDATLVEGIDTRELYDAPERISLIAHHIIEHHNMKTRNRQYSALFATASIPSLLRYYDQFKSIPHELKIAATFSVSQPNVDMEDRAEHPRESLERIIQDYNDLFGTNCSTDDENNYNKDISERMKRGEIDVLIVVNRFLTGWDSPTTSVLYLDKKLQYQDLVQAYSRTNRVERSTKPFGNIVCYRNLKQNTDMAICLYSRTENASDVLMKDYAHYQAEFRDKVAKLQELVATPAAVNHLEDEKDQKRFIVRFRDLAEKLNILQGFTDFTFTKEALGLSRQMYEDYKSKYLLIYEKAERESKNKVSVLDDVDFLIELMETDRINVGYILNLLRKIDFSTEETKEKGIRDVEKQLERSDDRTLRKKVGLLQEFLQNVVPALTNEDDVEQTYYDFEMMKKGEAIASFAEENQLSGEELAFELSNFEFTGRYDSDRMKKVLPPELKFKERRGVLGKIQDFFERTLEKFQ